MISLQGVSLSEYSPHASLGLINSDSIRAMVDQQAGVEVAEQDPGVYFGMTRNWWVKTSQASMVRTSYSSSFWNAFCFRRLFDPFAFLGNVVLLEQRDADEDADGHLKSEIEDRGISAACTECIAESVDHPLFPRPPVRPTAVSGASRPK
jgi:hypothetical protein